MEIRIERKFINVLHARKSPYGGDSEGAIYND